jgi:hypothetical protein
MAEITAELRLPKEGDRQGEKQTAKVQAA